MIIIMKPKASQEAIKNVTSQIEKQGLQVHLSEGHEVTIVGVVGDKSRLNGINFEVADGVDKVVAVTDSIMAAGLPDGDYKLGVNDVIVKDGDAKLPNGTRAGSTLTLCRALGRIMEWTGADVEKAAQLMTRNPAALMGWHRKGDIAPGKDADLVLMDKLTVKATFVKGEEVYRG